MSIPVTVTDASDPGANGPITDWAITFGDGGSDSGPGPWMHDYAGAGRYSIRLEVTDSVGATSAIAKMIELS